jgi:hypothetical protein
MKPIYKHLCFWIMTAFALFGVYVAFGVMMVRFFGWKVFIDQQYFGGFSAGQKSIQLQPCPSGSYYDPLAYGGMCIPQPQVAATRP